MATDQTRAEAADPNTAPARLQELATADRELWPLIAANPTAYPALLDWMGEHGGEDVRGVIAARGTESTSALPPTAPPVAPPPGQPLPGQPLPGQPLPGQPLPGQPLPGQAPPGQAPPGYAYGAPSGGQGGGGSKKGLWITLAIVIGLLLVSGIGVGVWALTKGGSDGDDQKTSEPTPTSTDEDDEEEEGESVDDICDVITEIDDAAWDIYLYFPGLDDEAELDDAVDVLEQYRADAPRDLRNAMDELIDYADQLRGADDLSDIPEDDADAASEAYDVVLDYYLDC